MDALVRDAQAALAALDGHELDGPLAEAAELLGLVAGQDVEAGEDGVFASPGKVARDRLISTVDVEARHGHKSRARTFDGYKTHLAVDPDDELITAVAVTAANTADRQVIDELLDQPGTGRRRRHRSGIGEPAADPAMTVAVQRVVCSRKALRCTGIRPTPTGPPWMSRRCGATTCAPRYPRCATPTAIPKTSSPSTCRWHRHLPGSPHCDHRHGCASPLSPLRCAVSILPAAGGLHESPSRAGHQHPPP